MPDRDRKKFYVTTPIYYVNARPHIGHAYTTIVADVLARRHRLLGEDVFFLTGTDEHGQKIERSAAAAGIPPQQFADKVSAQFRTLWDRMGLTYDRYIRTTDPQHKLGAQQLFRTLYERGFIYLSTYTGAYCVSDEAFVDAPVGTPCPDCGRLLEEVTEENFFFKLSEFQKPLIDLIESGQLSVEPESRRNEVLSFLRGNSMERSRWPELWEDLPDGTSRTNEGLLNKHLEMRLADGQLKKSERGDVYTPGALKDLSVSRSSFTWGIPVPDEVQKAAGATQNHIIYVWLDALANYITAIGYGATEEQAHAEFAKYWPAELQLVGKEIIRFHCVYWPAFLLAAGLPLPKAITAHGWLLFDNSKMSKSKGNIVRTETILEAFGALCPSVHVADTALGSQTEGAGASRPLNDAGEEKRALAQEWLPQTSTEDSLRKGTTSVVPQTPGEGNGALAPEVRLATPEERDLFAADVLRYFLLREIPFGQDGSFSFEALVTRYNADLVNGYGNLVKRVLTLIAREGGAYFATDDEPIVQSIYTEGGEELLAYGTDGIKKFANLTTHLSLAASLPDRDFLGQLDFWRYSVDLYLSFNAPWKLDPDLPEERARLQEILQTAAESIRIITALLYPILPYATARVWAQLGLGDIETAARNGELNNLQWGGLKPGTKLGPLVPIFPRADKGLAQLMNDMENPQPSDSQLTTGQDSSSLAPSSKLATERNLSKLAGSELTAHSSPASLKQASTPTPAAHVPADPTHPAAPLVALDEPSGTLPVAGSTAYTSGPDVTPSHAEAPASGIFANEPSKPSTLDPEPSSSQITIDDFAKVELRVAEIKVCERIPKADKLLRLEVDLGHEQRQILSGIAEFYTPEDLVGRRIIVITNLAPRKMRGLDSHGMLLAASGPDGGKPILATVGEGVPLGARLK